MQVTEHQLLYEFGTFSTFLNCQTVVRDGSGSSLYVLFKYFDVKYIKIHF